MAAVAPARGHVRLLRAYRLSVQRHESLIPLQAQRISLEAPYCVDRFGPSGTLNLVTPPLRSSALGRLRGRRRSQLMSHELVQHFYCILELKTGLRKFYQLVLCERFGPSALQPS
jgi:hypothetical protein